MNPARAALEGAYESEKMLEVYVYDFLKRRNFEESAKAFLHESNLPTENTTVAIDAPDGFLLEWWTVFWDIFKVQSGQPHTAVAASYLKTQQITRKEQQQQQQWHMMQGRQNTGISSSYTHFNKVEANAPRMTLELSYPGDTRLRQPAMFSSELLATQKSLPQSCTTDRVQSMHVDHNGESFSNQPALISNSPLLAATIGDQQMPKLVGNPGFIIQGGDAFQLPVQMQLNEIQPGWSPSATPMMPSQGSEHFRQSSILGSLPSRQALVSSQMQQQMYPSLHNQASHQCLSTGVRLNSPHRDGFTSNDGNDVLELSEKAVSSPSASQGSQGNRDMSFIMLQAQQQQLQMQSNAVVRQQLQRQQLSQHDSLSAVGGPSRILPRIPVVRKRKEKSDSSQDPANSFGVTSIREFWSASSPTSDHTRPMTSLSKAQQQSQMVRPMGSASIAKQQINANGELLEDGNPAAADVELQVDSSLPILHEDVISMTSQSVVGDPGSTEVIPAEMNGSPKFMFREVGCLKASTSKVLCCHFSSDGKLLASAGHDKKVNLWNMNTLKLEHTLEEHMLTITDVRFSPTSTHLATSSFDKTVRVWEVANPTNSIRTFVGHATSVWALDFHPNTEDLLCSCDGDSEIRYWSVSEGTCIKSFKGGVTQLRFQPIVGRFLAASAESVVTIFDVETDSSVCCLLNHSKPVNNLCWSSSGDILVSLTEDYVRVWSVGNLRGGELSKCIHELSCKDKVFQSCVFHPSYPSLLVIGCYQSVELWNMVEDKILTLKAHDGLVVSLVACPVRSLVASASHDKCVKLWQ